MFDSKFMDLALDIAKRAYEMSEVPVGAVLVESGTSMIVETSHNLSLTYNSPIEHAELIVLKNASKKLKKKYLTDCDLYVTLEPCPLCAAAISAYRVRRLYYAAQDTKQGAVESASTFFNQKNCFFKPEIYSGIKSEESSILLKKFFTEIRNMNSEKF